MSPSILDIDSFLNIKSRAELAAWIGVSDRKLRYLLYGLDDSVKYETFAIRKRSGGVRTIDAPVKFLKHAQTKILRALEVIAPPTGIAKGFVKDRSIYDHASMHSKQRWVVTADIESFFPEINFGRVRGAFKSRPFSFPDQVATCLAQLCCKENALPQGAPTSPVISNLICRSLDRELVSIARKNKCVVTRYADDICFSTSVKELPSALVSDRGGAYVPSDALVEVVRRAGFRLNPNKFRVLHRQDRQIVTGLVVNRGVSMPRKWRRQLRTLLHVLDKHGEEDAYKIISDWREFPAVRNRMSKSAEGIVRGKAAFAGWIDRKADTNFVQSLHRSYPKLRAILPRTSASRSFRAMTEGESDVFHLQSALESFQAGGDYLELAPSFRNYSGDKGDKDLWETLQRIAKSNVHELTIGIFDCDNEPFMKARSVDPGGFVRLGQMVYAFFLQRKNSSMTGPFCIESLYDRAELQQPTPEGRRIFFSDEFDVVSGVDASGRYKRMHPKKVAVVVSDRVERLSDSFSALLSKMELARMIASKEKPFENISFDGFGPTFKAIRDLISFHEG